MAATEGIWLVPSGGTNEFNEPLPSGDPVWIPNAIVLPRKSFENPGRGLVVISGFEIFIKPAPRFEIMATDSVLVRSHEYQIDGVPGVYPGNKALQMIVKRAGS
ncbi:MAG TPA: hypothetical protein VFX41_07845 [Actinomycetales bacterium]|nr:hypothetical protein [Actinomycetales bacterium]